MSPSGDHFAEQTDKERPKGCDRASAKDFHEIRAVFTRGVA